MAMWTVAQDGGQTVFQLEDQQITSIPSSRLSTVLKHACGTAFNTRQSHLRLQTLAQVVPLQPNYGQVIDMAPPRIARLTMVDQEDTLTMEGEAGRRDKAPQLAIVDQEDTLSLEGEAGGGERKHPSLFIENSLGKIRYSIDKSVVTFEPKAGGSVTFVDCGEGKVTIIAKSPDGMERRYPAGTAAFKAALKLKNGNVNWLGGRYFAFEQCSYTFKNEQGMPILTISDLEYSDAGHLISFTLPSGNRWVAIPGTTFYQCLEPSGKAKFPVPLQLGPMTLREDGLYAHGADGQYNIGVPLKQGSLKQSAQAACGHESAGTDSHQSKLKDVLGNQTAQPCSIQTWQKSAKQRHLQSVSILVGKANPQPNAV